MKGGTYRRRHVGLCMSGHVYMPTKRRRARPPLYRGGELALAVLAQRGIHESLACGATYDQSTTADWSVECAPEAADR